MGLFDFFGKKKKKMEVSPNLDESHTPKVLISTKHIDVDSDDTYTRVFRLGSEQYRITEINKKIVEIYKGQGFDKANLYFERFWAENQLKFELTDAHRLINNFINILVKEKLSSEQILNFIDTKLLNFEESRYYDYVILKAKMLKKFDLQKALEYLKSKNEQEELNISDPEKFVETIFLESEYLLKNKNYDEAFRNLSRTTLVIPMLDQFKYLRWSQKISNLNAEICLKDVNPKYDSYLFYAISAYLLEVLFQISSFPHSSNFYRWKAESKDSRWPFSEDGDFNKAMESLSMLNSKTELLQELKVFAYFDLPTLYGIPGEFDEFDKIIRFADDNPLGWYELSQISDKLQSKSAAREVIAIHTFVQELISKYYKISKKNL
jgi:tetratricopeptide (TPR) repeat protein